MSIITNVSNSLTIKSARAERITDFPVGGGLVWTAIPMVSAAWNDGFWNIANPSRMTATDAGRFLYAFLLFTPTVSAEYAVTMNGLTPDISNRVYFSTTDTVSTTVGIGSITTVFLNSGDYLESWVRNSVGFTVQSSLVHAWFSLIQIS